MLPFYFTDQLRKAAQVKYTLKTPRQSEKITHQHIPQKNNKLAMMTDSPSSSKLLVTLFVRAILTLVVVFSLCSVLLMLDSPHLAYLKTVLSQVYDQLSLI